MNKDNKKSPFENEGSKNYQFKRIYPTAEVLADEEMKNRSIETDKKYHAAAIREDIENKKKKQKFEKLSPIMIEEYARDSGFYENLIEEYKEQIKSATNPQKLRKRIIAKYDEAEPFEDIKCELTEIQKIGFKIAENGNGNKELIGNIAVALTSAKAIRDPETGRWVDLILLPYRFEGIFRELAEGYCRGLFVAYLKKYKTPDNKNKITHRMYALAYMYKVKANLAEPLTRQQQRQLGGKNREQAFDS